MEEQHWTTFPWRCWLVRLSVRKSEMVVKTTVSNNILTSACFRHVGANNVKENRAI